VGADRLTVHSHPSAFALACARLGWPAAETALVSTVTQPAEALAAHLAPGRRIVAYATGADGAARLARVLRERGYGPSRFVVLEQLGGTAERVAGTTADAWGDAPADALHAVAVECRLVPGEPFLPRTPGLPDDAYGHDGQLTKRAIRAVTVSSLRPAPGRLLWDVGAGSGSIAIEWLRAEPGARAVAVEARPDRVDRIAENARRLGVPHLLVTAGAAPGALAALEPPDAVFIGGGLTVPGVLERCWTAVRPGGRIVANAVTLEGEQVLQRACAEHGGELLRLAVSHAEPLGGLHAWRPQLPVVQWTADKESR
jgi:precorrin-6Y C5,15-methyltransferase (decarboxylating)